MSFKKLVLCVMVLAAVMTSAAWADNYKDIFDAAVKGTAEEIEERIKAGDDINAKDDEYGRTPLMLAAGFNQREKYTDVVRTLIELGAAVNARNKDGWTALFYAANKRSSTEIFEILLDAGTEVDARDKDGETALMTAVLARNTPNVIKCLTDHGANPNQENKSGWSLLGLAKTLYPNPAGVIGVLRQAGATGDVDLSYSSENFRAAVESGHIPTVEEILKKGTAEGKNVLNPSRGETPLMWARTPEMAKFLLDNGADVKLTNNGWTALMSTATRGDAEVAEVLIAAGADVNAQTESSTSTALMLAAEYGHEAVVRALLKAGADPNIRDKYENTALLEAVDENRPVGVIIALLEGGADANIHDKHGNTPLSEAIDKEAAETITALVKGGADVNAVDKRGKTPLTYALDDTRPLAVITALLNAGADVNAKMDKSGMTPLMVAVRDEDTDIEVIKLLIEAGADVNAQNTSGKTALQIAEREKFDEAIKILKAAGAK